MSDRGAQEEQTDGGDGRVGAEAIKRTGPFFGGVVAASGVLSALVGAFLASGLIVPASFIDTVPATSLGFFLGLIGHVLGARRLGRAAMAFAVIALLFGLFASQGYIPGLNATDYGPPAKP